MNDLITLPKCSVTLTGATFCESITFDEWAELLKRCVKVKESIQWVIGDAMNFAEQRWCAEGKERVSMSARCRIAVESLPYEPEAVRRFASVANKVLPGTRVPTLSFHHHMLVAPLDQKKQRYYLKIAARDKLSVADLNELIRDNEGTIDEGGGSVRTDGIMRTITGAALWVKQQNLADPKTWPVERRVMVKNELRPLVEFYNRL